MGDESGHVAQLRDVETMDRRIGILSNLLERVLKFKINIIVIFELSITTIIA